MSGRAKGAAATPEEEREQLRQLTRELHEAAQDARDAERRLRAARKEIADGAEAVIEETVNRHQIEIDAVIKQNYATVQRTLEVQERETREHYTELLGQDGADLIARVCGMILHLTVPTITVDNWIKELSNIAAQHAVTGCSCLGCLAMTKATAPAVDILVATPEGLRDFRAAGGDVGFVIDMR